MTSSTSRATGYQLKGTLLEACSCGVLCPCWIGENPDEGYCHSFNAYHFESGHIGGLDIAGMNVVEICHIPGNVLAPKSWRVAMFVDARGTEAQRQALVSLFRGEYGGPLADLAGIKGEIVTVQAVPIRHEIHGGTGIMSIPGILEAEMAPYHGPDGSVTTLRDSLFSTVPGSPAYVGKASKNRVSLPQFDMVWEYEGRNAIQSDYQIEFAG